MQARYEKAESGLWDWVGLLVDACLSKWAESLASWLWLMSGCPPDRLQEGLPELYHNLDQKAFCWHSLAFHVSYKSRILPILLTNWLQIRDSQVSLVGFN